MKITEKQFEKIQAYFPVQRGNVKISNYDFINAILYIAENGCKWRALPKEYGNWNSIYKRFNSDRRCHQRSLDKIKNAISKNSDIESSRKDAVSKLETASSGFAAIGTCTTVTPKKLTDVFEERNRSTNRMIEESFRQIKNASSSISKKIDNLDNRIHQLQNEKDEGQRRERQLREHITEQNRIIRNASFEMACNRKYLHY